MGDVDHGPFIESAQEFKRQLVGGGFTPDEIAAMLGTYVLTTYQQHLNQQLPPEFYEMLTKQNRLSDIALSEDD